MPHLAFAYAIGAPVTIEVTNQPRCMRRAYTAYANAAGRPWPAARLRNPATYSGNAASEGRALQQRSSGGGVRESARGAEERLRSSKIRALAPAQNAGTATKEDQVCMLGGPRLVEPARVELAGTKPR